MIAAPATGDAVTGVCPVPPTDCLRLGVLVSGRGSNLQALLDGVSAGALPARVVAVASNRSGAQALSRARVAQVPAVAFPRGEYRSVEERDEAMTAFLQEHAVELVVLAGYDRVLSPSVLSAFSNRIVNIHPSLLPSFAGSLHAQADALRHGVKVTGCTVHFVTDELDSGPILLQRPVRVEEDDTPETLAARILAEEHRALPEAIRLIAAGRVRLVGRRCHVRGEDT